MQKIFSLILILVFNSVLGQNPANPSHKFILVIHGGAGTILKSQMSAEKEKAYQDGLKQALQDGHRILAAGGSALNAVEAVVKILENNPLFNAGKGAVFTHEGKNEMDAAIMDGKTLGAGSVAGVTTIKNPITAARAVMEKSNHVMMTGIGAEKFAASVGIEIVDPSYFYTPERWKNLQDAKKEDSLKAAAAGKSSSYQFENKDYKFGTVGAVALDRYGNLAAATSTGGMTNKQYGRIGDAPIIGAGTYANNATCAVSCTGWGEYFIRLVVAKSISDMMEYKGMSVKAAADEMIFKKVPALGGDGGLIVLDNKGNFAMPFSTDGMYRGYIKEDGSFEIKIYKE